MGIWHVDDSKVATILALSDCNPGPAFPLAVLRRPRQDIFNFLLGYIMTVDVRLASGWIDEEAKLHPGIL